MSSTEPNRETGSNSTAFVNLSEDGSLTSPSAVGVGKGPAEGDAFMNDEGRVITTLEARRKSSPASNDNKVIIHSQTIIKPADIGTAAVKVDNDAGKNQTKKEDLLAKMKSRLSKQIDLKMVASAKSQQQSPTQQQHQQSPTQHDTSGSIEIPHDLILSSDLPATPLATASAKEIEDHDLIAILEGDDVEITEHATEIEVRVGGGDDGIYSDEQVLEEIQISFVDEQDMELDQKEREKEIAMRQMASLPILPKGRRPKHKALEADSKPTQATKSGSAPKPAPAPKSAPSSKPVPLPKVAIKSEPANLVTIKGQTTIKPVPRPMIIPKKEPVEVGPGSTPKKSVTTPKSVMKASPVSQKHSQAHIASPSSDGKLTIPVSKQSPNDIISSIVSDWDDEPMSLKAEPLSPMKSPVKRPKTPPFVSPMAPPPQPPIEEPKRSRIIKKKIIWDPDNPESHMSFASFVKSNRGKLPDSPQPVKDTPPLIRPPGTGLRRKRAESVAVHMIKDPPYTPPPFLKRARTPEPTTKTMQSTLSIPKVSRVGRKNKSEIEKLLGDEGAINMLYDVECENSNKDLLKDADLKLDSDDEDEKLLAKAKIITDVVIKQGTSPNETTTHVPRVRAKRASTPQQTSVSPSPITTTTTSTVAPVTRKPGGTSNGPGRKRKQPSNTSDDWDYVYNSRKTCDDAMIIRRRSNSSYSSSTSPRRLSVDQPIASNDNPTETASENSGFEFVKPTSKISPKPGNVKLDSSLVANMKGKLSKALGNKQKGSEDHPLSISIPAPPSPSSAGTPPEKKAKISPKPKVVRIETITTVNIDENGLNASLSSGESLQDKLNELKLSQLSCNHCGNYAEIVLAPKETKLKDVFTIELLNEMKAVLNLLKLDPITRAVLIRSSGKQFCRGIDVSYLIQTNAEKRKSAAQIFSGHLRNFLHTLAMFNKPLVAAVHGDVLGLGVTMLPMFEVVIAPDNSTFSTPYAMFGQLPEAMKIFSMSKNLKPKAITDLLYLCKKISATTAMDYGLVSDVVSPEKLQDKANNITKKLATMSSQALKSIKVNLRLELMNRLDDQLISEQKKLTQQWITPECQEKFKQFVSRGGEW